MPSAFTPGLDSAPVSTLTTDGDLYTRATGVIARITRASLAVDAAFSDAYSPISAGRLVHLLAYEPGTAQNKSTTSTTLVAVDTTNLRATFTVPASGKVLVKLCGRTATSSGLNLYWAILEGATQRGKTQFVTDEASGSRPLISIPILTGLTAGASVSLDWAWAVQSTGTGNLFIDASGITSGGAYMEIWAVP